MNIPAKHPLSSPFTPPVYLALAQQLRLKPSRWCLWLFSSLHALILFSIAYSQLPLWVQLLLALSVLLHQGYFVWQWQATPVYQLRYQHECWCLCAVAEPNAQQYKIVDWHLCSRYLLIVVVEDAQHRRSYWPIVYDSCRQEEFRWLRVTMQML